MHLRSIPSVGTAFPLDCARYRPLILQFARTNKTPELEAATTPASAMSDSSSFFDYSDDFEKTFNYLVVAYVIGGIVALVFWITVIYFCVRACRSIAERPRTYFCPTCAVSSFVP